MSFYSFELFTEVIKCVFIVFGCGRYLSNLKYLLKIGNNSLLPLYLENLRQRQFQVLNSIEICIGQPLL